MEYVPSEHRWAPLGVPEVVELLRGVSARWWLSGGWAIEEFAGHLDVASREHGDIDITVAGQDWPAVHAALRPVLEVWIARNGHRYDTATTAVDAGVDNLWAREPAGGPWRLQINLEPIAAQVWFYRRDERIARPTL